MRKWIAGTSICLLGVVAMAAEQAAQSTAQINNQSNTQSNNQPNNPSNSQPNGGAPPGAASSAMGATNPAWPTISDAVDYKNDTEAARINSINFYGNQLLSREALLATLSIKPGQVMQQELMGQSLELIKAAYAARNIPVEVRPRVSHPKQNFVDVNFLINESNNSKGEK